MDIRKNSINYVLMGLSILILFMLALKISELNRFQELEGFNPDEALQNIASVYNRNDMKVTNLTVTGKSNVVPRGVIVAFTGTSPPAGWALCDGKNGTPDLRGRFIYGYGLGSGATINKRGGAETHKLTVAEIPSHKHKNGFIHNKGLQHDDDNEPHIHLGTSGEKMQGNNYTNAVGSDRPHNNMPPYHVLAYIMKL